METTISLLAFLFTLAVTIIVEKIMFRREPSQEKLAKYQQELDIMDADLNERYNLKLKHDAYTQLMQERKEAKTAVLIFAGMFLMVSFLVLIAVTKISHQSMGIILISCLFLICAGIINLSKSRTRATFFLAILFCIGGVMMLIFDKLMDVSPYAFFGLVGLVAVIGGITMIKSFFKK